MMHHDDDDDDDDDDDALAEFCNILLLGRLICENKSICQSKSFPADLICSKHRRSCFCKEKGLQ